MSSCRHGCVKNMFGLKGMVHFDWGPTDRVAVYTSITQEISLRSSASQVSGPASRITLWPLWSRCVRHPASPLDRCTPTFSSHYPRAEETDATGRDCQAPGCLLSPRWHPKCSGTRISTDCPGSEAFACRNDLGLGRFKLFRLRPLSSYGEM